MLISVDWIVDRRFCNDELTWFVLFCVARCRPGRIIQSTASAESIRVHVLYFYLIISMEQGGRRRTEGHERERQNDR